MKFLAYLFKRLTAVTDGYSLMLPLTRKPVE